MDVCSQHYPIATDVTTERIIGRQTTMDNYTKGYIALPVVLKECQKLGVGKKLAIDVINIMKTTCNKIVLAEIDNSGSTDPSDL
jgi:hypothetical protein